MTLDDIKVFYGFQYDAEVARKFNLTKTAIGKWRSNGIPTKRQAVIQVLTNNKLKADLSVLEPEEA